MSLAQVLSGPPEEVAPRLLGAVLTHEGVSVRLTEVEAYAGPRDPASHAFAGRTARNATMFGPPGHLYVYFTYGMHFCANVVTGVEGEASGVLLRSGEVVAGRELAVVRRGRPTDLARGPARLAQALGLDRSHDGLLLEGLLTLAEPAPSWSTGPRVGVSKAVERPWRFWITDDPEVSTYRRAVPRRR